MQHPDRLRRKRWRPDRGRLRLRGDDAESAFADFKPNGLQKDAPGFGIEEHGGTSWKVFYVVAPDGLCYWFGERQSKIGSS